MTIHENAIVLLQNERTDLSQQLNLAKAQLTTLTAERDVLRGVDCGADGDGPCGVCIKCLTAEWDGLRAENDALMAQVRVLTGYDCPSDGLVLLNVAITRKEFLHLPLDARRRILEQQADALAHQAQEETRV